MTVTSTRSKWKTMSYIGKEDPWVGVAEFAQLPARGFDVLFGQPLHQVLGPVSRVGLGSNHIWVDAVGVIYPSVVQTVSIMTNSRGTFVRANENMKKKGNKSILLMKASSKGVYFVRMKI